MLDTGFMKSIARTNQKVFAEMDNFEVIDVSEEFFDAYTTDGDTQFDHLFWDYQEAEQHEREVIDLVFLRLCGYTYQTLVRQHLGLAES